MISVTQARTITPTRLFIYVSHVVIQWVPKRVGVGGVGGHKRSLLVSCSVSVVVIQ